MGTKLLILDCDGVLVASSLPPGDFADRLRRRTLEAFRQGLEPVAGIVEALERTVGDSNLAALGRP